MSAPFTLRNNRTGDTITLPPPDFLGRAVVLFNGRVVERVIYSDVHDLVIFQDGSGRRMRAGDEFARYLVDQLERRAYRGEATQ